MVDPARDRRARARLRWNRSSSTIRVRKMGHLEAYPKDEPGTSVTPPLRPMRIHQMNEPVRSALHANDHQPLASAWDAFRQHVRDLLAFPTADVDLPSRQQTALDFEVALRGVDPRRSLSARNLAAELLTALTMIERNPVDRVACRSTAQRLLKALAAPGGTRCRLADARERSGLEATHLSNILVPLVVHGFVTVTPDPADSRGKLLSLTARGMAAIDGPETHWPQARDPDGPDSAT